MIIECCSQEKTFVRYYALLGARFCHIKKEFQVHAMAGSTDGTVPIQWPSAVWLGRPASSMPCAAGLGASERGSLSFGVACAHLLFLTALWIQNGVNAVTRCSARCATSDAALTSCCKSAGHL
eukprot:GHRR01018556.1.p2 GENE.GHRR01018556.1~~GHRR01018556.1.p2  ORF type:complete len:123 (-),score=14.95 GHRR01018556.1:446-814(-)